MPKPEKVRYSGAAILVDGVQLKRVQNFSADSDIPNERILELANSGIVDFVDQSPSVSVTIDTNLYGSVDNAALIADAAIDLGVVSNYADHRRGYYSHKLGTPNATIRTVTQSHMLEAYCTIAVPILQESTSIARTMVLPRAALTGYSLNFDVGGLASENFTLTSFEKEWYFNYLSDVRVYKLTNHNIGHTTDATRQYMMNNVNGGLSGTSQAFGRLGSAIGASTYPNATFNFDIVPIGLIAGNNFYRSVSMPAATNPFQFTGSGEFYFSTSRNMRGVVTVATSTWPKQYSTPLGREGEDIYLVFKPQSNQTWSGLSTNSANPGYALVSTAGSYGGVGKGYITAWLWNAGTPAETTYTAAGKALRLQTVAVDVSMTSENLEELGNFQTYGIVRIPPVDVTVTVTANDSDIEMWSRLAGKKFSTMTEGELYTGLFNGNNQLRIEVYKDRAKVILLETITVSNMTVTGDSYSVSVGGNASQEITFLADNVTLAGSGVTP
jgi:hypothetical protein